MFAELPLTPVSRAGVANLSILGLLDLEVPEEGTSGDACCISCTCHNLLHNC